jgi:hypothetical protein
MKRILPLAHGEGQADKLRHRERGTSMDTIDIIVAGTNLMVAIFAGIALFVGIRQIHISREVSALAAYENYHMACLQYPEFAGGRLDFVACDPKKFDCYCTFVLYALMTGERVLKLFPDDKDWIYAVKDDIRLHRRFIRSDHFVGYRNHQHETIQRLIHDVLAECEDANPKPSRTSDGPPATPARRGGRERKPAATA